MNKPSIQAPALLVALLAVAGTGCSHMTTKVPGVLDMRSDASGAPVDMSPVAMPARSGFDAILYGEGVQGTGDITITDRKFWAVRLVPILNESATEEIAAALGTGALRKVTIGEQFSTYGVAITYIAPVIPVIGGLASLVLPPYDAKLTATRVKLGDAAAPAAPPAPGTGG